MSVPIKSYEHDSNKLERLVEYQASVIIVHRQRDTVLFNESFLNLTGLGLQIDFVKVVKTRRVFLGTFLFFSSSQNYYFFVNQIVLHEIL
jgi:hypothetical protein